MIDCEDHLNSREQSISEYNVSYEELKQEILPYISKQQDTQIRDSFDNRWIKCKKCGTVDMDHKFCMYGGKGEVNLGICYDCIRKK